MKKLLFYIFVVLTVLCSLVTIFIGAESYLALTGLDLLVSAVKTAPLYASILAVISNFLWLITLLLYRSVKTDNKNNEMK